MSLSGKAKVGKKSNGVKRIPYGRQAIDKEDIDSVVKVLKSDWITQGPGISEFELRLCKYTGAKYAVAVSSGTAALHVACLAAGIKSGDEVITSPVTFAASANCVLYCGGRPVFADIQQDSVNIDPVDMKKRITDKTKAVIPVHFAGHPCDLEEIRDIAKSRNLLVIEDACHALGSIYKGDRIGSLKYSDMAVFSFHPVKAITSGEGGAVLTNDKDLYQRLMMFRNHGITKDVQRFTIEDMQSIGVWYYEMQDLGFNYRITDVQCALAASQLKKLDKFINKRRELVGIYNLGLSGLSDLILPVERPYVKSSWHIYYIRLKDPDRRKTIFDKLRESGIGSQVHYIPVHLQPYYRKVLGYKDGDYPKAERYYKSTITIPLFYSLRKNEVEYIISKLKEIV